MNKNFKDIDETFLIISRQTCLLSWNDANVSISFPLRLRLLSAAYPTPVRSKNCHRYLRCYYRKIRGLTLSTLCLSSYPSHSPELATLLR